MAFLEDVAATPMSAPLPTDAVSLEAQVRTAAAARARPADHSRQQWRNGEEHDGTCGELRHAHQAVAPPGILQAGLSRNPGQAARRH